MGLPDRQYWDADGSYEAALMRIIRGLHRGTGCKLTANMVRSLAFAEGDGVYWVAMQQAVAKPVAAE